MALAAHAKERLGQPLLFPDQTTFKEFAIRVGRPAEEVIGPLEPKVSIPATR